jgi:cytosine/adenosine deaminase-related metal-dependent hydrolase
MMTLSTDEQKQLALILEANLALATLATMGQAIGKVKSDADLAVVIHAVLGFASTSIFASIRSVMRGPDLTPEKLAQAFHAAWENGLRATIDKVFLDELARMSSRETAQRTDELIAEVEAGLAVKH